MLRMRLSEGVDTEFFAATFGLDFERIFGKYLQLYSKNGFMEKRGRCWCFTPKGMFVSSYILSSMLDFDSDILKGIWLILVVLLPLCHLLSWLPVVGEICSWASNLASGLFLAAGVLILALGGRESGRKEQERQEAWDLLFLLI